MFSSEDTHLRSELLKMIMQYFPEDFKDNDFHRNAFRDKVIECASLAKEVMFITLYKRHTKYSQIYLKWLSEVL